MEGIIKNKYPGKCHSCGRQVRRGEGTLERAGGKWLILCADCCCYYNKSDNSSYEDRAYEDQCAKACGFDGNYEASRGDYEGACLARAEYEGNLL
jgi:hypothetical protein